jgi:hypothetical protein
MHDQIHRVVSTLHPDGEISHEIERQLYILDCAEATSKRLKKQSNQGRMVEVTQRFDVILQQVN